MSGALKLVAPRIAVLVGSARTGSMNARLAAAAEKLIAETEPPPGCPPVEVISYTQTGPLMAALPLYNQDIEDESGLPAEAKELKALLSSCHGLLVASPEFNGLMTPLLVNSISWASRSHEKDEPMYSAFKGKAAAVMATSPGPLGGLRGLPHVEALLGNLGCHLVGSKASVGGAFQAFAEDGSLKDARHNAMVKAMLQNLIESSAMQANRAVIKGLAAQALCAEYGEIIVPGKSE